MRALISMVFLAVLVAGCDGTSTPYKDGTVDGTYVLPDGTTGTFSSRASAQAFRYSGLGTSDTFQFGTAFEPEASGTRPSVRISQSGLRPTPGTFSPSFARDNSLPPIGASISIQDVPGFEVEIGGRPSADAQIWYGPEGTVTLRVEDQRIRGTFDLYGKPEGAADSVQIRITGRFDTPWVEAR